MESMLKVLFYINIFAILMSCHSCRREKANVEITNCYYVARVLIFQFV